MSKFGGTVKLTGESEYRKALDDIAGNLKVLGSEMKAVTSQYDKNDKSVENLSGQNNVLTKQIQEQKDKLKILSETLKTAKNETGENSNTTKKWQVELNSAEAQLNTLNKKLDNNENAMRNAGNEAEKAGGKFSTFASKAKTVAGRLGSGLASAAKIGAAGVTAIVGAATAAGTALLGVANNTEEYRIAQGKLNTAYEAAKMSGKSAQTAYKEFYKILGDTDTATEASQLLAKLTTSEKDLTKWTKIAAGVNGTFGDSLPIEGLIEAANETAKVGKVTGPLADALNWAAISEDDFNDKLAACSSETERNKLIMDTLSSTYKNATDAFYKNNAEVVKARENQAKFNEATGELGNTVTKTKNKLISEFLPSVTGITKAINGMLSGQKGSEKKFADSLSEMINKAAKKIPQFVSAGMKVVTSLAKTVIPELAKTAVTVVKTIMTTLEENRASLINTAMKVVTTLIDGVMDLVPDFAKVGLEIIAALMASISQNTEPIIETITSTIAELSDVLIENLPILINGATQLINKLLEKLPSILGVLGNKLPEIIESITTALLDNMPIIVDGINNFLSVFIEEVLPNLIKSITKTLPKLIKSLTSSLKKLIPTIIQGIISIMDAIIEALPEIIQTLADALPDIISSLISGVMELLPVIIDGIIQIVIAIIDNLPQIIKILVDDIPNLVTTIITAILDNLPIIITGLVQLVGGIVEAIPQIIKALLEAVPGIIDDLCESLSDGIANVIEVGKHLIEGLWQGISDSAEWLWNKLTEWMSGLWDGIKEFFGIHSPSTQMAWIGEMLVDGLAGAVDKTGTKAVTATRGMSKNILGVMSDLQNEMPTEFYTDINANVRGRYLTEHSPAYGNGSNVNVNVTFGDVTLNNDMDIRNVAEKVSNYIVADIMKKGGAFG